MVTLTKDFKLTEIITLLRVMLNGKGRAHGDKELSTAFVYVVILLFNSHFFLPFRSRLIYFLRTIKLSFFFFFFDQQIDHKRDYILVTTASLANRI